MKLNQRQRKALGHCKEQRTYFFNLYESAQSTHSFFTAIAAYNSYVKWNNRSNRYFRILFS